MEKITTHRHGNIQWDIVPFEPYEREPHKKHGIILRDYCADGDGFVVVRVYESGNHRVLDQGDYRGDYATLEAALDKAAKVLKQVYFEIWEKYYEGEEA
jgi:hypothetical protein